MGCTARLVLGGGAFVGGALLVLVWGMPHSFGRSLATSLVEKFNDTFAGRLELWDSHVLDAFGPQEVRRFELRDPEGAVVATGAARANSLRGWVDEGVELQLMFDVVHLVRYSAGDTNLERALTLRDPGQRRHLDSIRFGRHGSIVAQQGEPVTPASLLRVLYERVEALDLAATRLTFEDRSTDPPSVFEADRVDATLRARPSGRSLGVAGTFAGGALDLGAELGSWRAGEALPDWRAVTLTLDGAASEQLDPLFERATGLPGLATHVGPTLGRLRARFDEADGTTMGSLELAGHGVEAACAGVWSQGVLRSQPGERLRVAFADESRLAAWLVPKLLPFVESRVGQVDGARSTLLSEAFVAGPVSGPLEARFTLQLGTRSFLPTTAFRAVPEFADLETWRVADEPVRLTLEGDRIHFQATCEGVLGKSAKLERWLVHGSRSIDGRDLDAAVRLTAAQAQGDEPTTISVRVTGEGVDVERRSD